MHQEAETSGNVDTAASARFVLRQNFLDSKNGHRPSMLEKTQPGRAPQTSAKDGRPEEHQRKGDGKRDEAEQGEAAEVREKAEVKSGSEMPTIQDETEKRVAAEVNGPAKQLQKNPEVKQQKSRVQVVSAGFNTGNMVSVTLDGSIIVDPATDAARGLHMVVIDPSAHSVASHAVYDLWGDADCSKRLAEAIKALPQGHIVLLALQDSGMENLDADLITALSLIGSTLEKKLDERESYVCIGIMGGVALMEKHGHEKLVVETVLPIFVNSEPRDPATRASSKTRKDALKKAKVSVGWPTGTPNLKLCCVVVVRIYEEDKAHLSVSHLREWLRYLSYAGVQRTYVYDAYENKLECLKEELRYLPYVTYIDWSHTTPYTMSGTHVAAYQDAIDNFKHECDWQTAIDIDEYPVAPRDEQPGFLIRYLANISPDVSEVSMANYLMLGPDSKDETRWLAERFTRKTKDPGNELVKPFYRPTKVTEAVFHHNRFTGIGITAREDELRLSHYWGARADDFSKTMSQRVKSITEDDGGLMQRLVDHVKLWSFSDDASGSR